MTEIVDVPMDASELDFSYIPPQTPDHDALSMASDASDDSDYDSDLGSFASSPPLHGFKSLDLIGTDDLILDEDPICLEDPYMKPTSDGVWLDLINAPNQEEVLRGWITTLLEQQTCCHVKKTSIFDFDDDCDSPEAHFDTLVSAATAEDSIKRLVVERYADHLAQQTAMNMEKTKFDLEAMQMEVNEIVERAGGSFDAGVSIAPRLASKIDLYAWLVPSKLPPYSKGKESVIALLALAEAVLAAPSETRRGVMLSTVVGIKLGLAFKKILANIPARTYGYYKRFGLKDRVQGCVAAWSEESSMGDVDWVAELS